MDETDRLLALGFGTGGDSKTKNLRIPYSYIEWDKYAPLESRFTVGVYLPPG